MNLNMLYIHLFEDERKVSNAGTGPLLWPCMLNNHLLYVS